MKTRGSKLSSIALTALIALSGLAIAGCASGGDDQQSGRGVAQVSSAGNSNAQKPEQAEKPEPAAGNDNRPPVSPGSQGQPGVQATEKAPIAGSSLPASSEPRVDGTWQSPIGRIVLKQNGTLVTGTVHYKDGSGTGTLKGKMTGRRLTFSANDNSGRTTHSATGEARFSKDGSRLIGTVRIEALGLEQPFVLTK